MAKKKTKKEKKERKNPQHELFCLAYAGGKAMEYFGNATKSYAVAYNFEEKIKRLESELLIIPYAKEKERKAKRKEINDVMNICAVNGNGLLRNTKIIDKCDELLSKLFNNDHMDRELVRVATQNKDLNSKVSAIKEYNRLKARVEEKTINNNVIYAWATGKNLEKGAKTDKK